MFATDSICCFIFSICVAIVTTAKVKVAVYEHVVISADDPEAVFTRQEAFQWMAKNLKVFEEQVRTAAVQGARIIVFPEYGITGFDHSRDSIIPFLEDIPDSDASWNPCNQPSRFQDTLVLQNLSCIAQTNKIYLVANMGDIKKCDIISDKTCPSDGRYQFNTNVVFDDDGKLIARYHKRNMYDETPLFDPSPTNEYVYFDTPFGKFGTIVCFDIMHYNPTQVLLNKYGIRNLLVTSAWNVFLPFIIPLQMYSGLAKKNNVNVIASNIRNELYQMAGSGIFGASTQVFSHVNFTSGDGELLFAVLETEIENTKSHTEIKPIADLDAIKLYMNETHNGSYHFELQIAYTVLHGLSGFAVTCQDSVCCSVKYTFKHRDNSETIVLSAVDENMVDPGIIHMQYCAVFMCSPGTNGSCNGVDLSVKSVFSEIKIQAYVDRGVTFPFVSTVFADELGEIQLDMEMESYQFDEKKAILYSNQFDKPLLAAVVFNTVYTEEPHSAESSGAWKLTATTCIIVMFLVKTVLL